LFTGNKNYRWLIDLIKLDHSYWLGVLI
jgi:hypothetical protein